MEMEGRTAGSPSASGRKSRQAVVVIHGMGEQRPMATLRGFVEAVWTSDHYLSRLYRKRVLAPHRPGQVRPALKWIVPDPITGSHEQRRITTPYDSNGRRTDFFEIYWADITQGTTRQRLYAWLNSLLWRKRADIPPDAVRLYRATVVFAVLLGIASFVLAVSFWQSWLGPFGIAVAIGLASAMFWLLDQFVVPYFGDVASYVRAEAGTVEKRALIRERGLALLRRLMDDGTYDRVILVSHSLGSMIAYDLLQILWAEYRPRGLDWRTDVQIKQAIDEVDRFLQLPSKWSRADLAAFRRAQWRLYEEIRSLDAAHGKGWKLSDFVTLGSPLTHAEFLFTHNTAAWLQGVEEKLFAICPPAPDSPAKKTIVFESYRDPTTKRRFHALHHGAAFAATRWTNIFDLGNLLTTGDPISGSMAENFGPGVDNIQVRLTWRILGKFRRLFTHTKYWDLGVRGWVIGHLPLMGASAGAGSGALSQPPSSGASALGGVSGDPGETELPPDLGHIKALQEAVDLARVLEERGDIAPKDFGEE
jgi:hypothetical protein